MRFLNAAAAIALVVMTTCACADETSDKLVAMCKSNAQEKNCECQVKVLIDNADPKLVSFLLAMAEGSAKAKSPEDKMNVMKDALKAAGLTMDEYEKLQAEAQIKGKDAMAACKT